MTRIFEKFQLRKSAALAFDALKTKATMVKTNNQAKEEAMKSMKAMN